MTAAIVVGVDGSTPGRAALRWALPLADRLGARIVLAHVVEGPADSDTDKRAREMLNSQVEFARTHLPNARVTTMLLHGDLVWELTAAATGARLLVVGTHKTGFVRGKVFGSRGVHLVGMATCPIAVVPEFTSRTRSGVVVGVDGSTGSDAAVAFACALANELGQELRLVHANPRDASDDTTPPAKREPAASDRALERAAAIACDSSEVSVTRRVLHRSAAEALVAESQSAAMVVLGRTPRRHSAETALGLVNHDVLLNLSGPIIVVPAFD